MGSIGKGEGHCLLNTFFTRAGPSLLFNMLKDEGHCSIGTFLAHIFLSLLVRFNHSILFTDSGPQIDSQRTRPYNIFDLHRRIIQSRSRLLE